MFTNFEYLNLNAMKNLLKRPGFEPVFYAGLLILLPGGKTRL